jgi:hypothetical protein
VVGTKVMGLGGRLSLVLLCFLYDKGFYRWASFVKR